jgi:type II restriction enzyme
MDRVRDRLFCPNCGAEKINPFETNRPVADFFCGACDEEYELKSQKNKFGVKVLDGAFGTMCHRLRASNNPNLLLLNYDLARLAVSNVFVVPKHFFVREIIEERKPLAPTARRAGWVGCNILLKQIPESGKIFFVRDGIAQPRESVLAQWQKTLFLREERAEARGWLIEVMKCVEEIGNQSLRWTTFMPSRTHLAWCIRTTTMSGRKFDSSFRCYVIAAIWSSYRVDTIVCDRSFESLRL